MLRYLAATCVISAMWTPAAFCTEGPLTKDELLRRSRNVLAQLDGELALPGLRAPVTVQRDRWGVPHIYAENVHDLFYAQGVVAAQDRLFQIDLWRRAAAGELAEVLGPEAIDRDRLARLVRYRGDMAAEWSSYGPDARDIAEAFTTGINDYIAAIGDRLPIEFQLAGYRPSRWRAEDVLGRMAGIVMVRNFQSELARAELIGAVGFEKARQLMPLDPDVAYEWPAELDPAGINRDVLALYKKATDKIRFAAADKRPMPSGGDGDAFDQGSNNWVVSGSRTASGKPILANDPHRPIALPSLRYLVHLHAPGWNVIGSGEPALPGVALGHNEDIAWGFTIAGTDQADVYVEETHPDDPTRYRVGGEWRSMQVEREKIAVAGRKEPVEVELLFTRHGPVIHEDRARRRAYALRWTGDEPGTAGYLGSLALNRATNWAEFQKAVEAWKLPSENLVYADRQGNIGWIAAALTPSRRAGIGVVPVPGASERYDWDGFLPISALPTEFNPRRGYIGTANANILPDGYRHPLAFEWAAPYRQRRVRDVLATQEKHTLDDSRRLQHDNVSLPGRTLAALARTLDVDDPSLRPYVELIRSWDGDLSADSQAGPLYANWLNALLDEFYGERVAKPQLDVVRGSSGVEPMSAALSDPSHRLWSSEFGGRRKAAELLRDSLRAAVEKTKKELGDDPSAWRWGKLHTAHFAHPLSSWGPEYAKAFDLGPVPRGGDGHTPNATTHDAQFRQTNGASYREIFDLADWDRGLVTSVPGQSGQPGSPHYDDLLPLWAAGEYFPLKFSRPAVDAVTIHRLTLRPR